MSDLAPEEVPDRDMLRDRREIVRLRAALTKIVELEDSGGDDLFHMTFQGAKKALLPGETLDREDFPTVLAGKCVGAE